MKHTDYSKEFKALDVKEREELIAAVKAHGGEYVFIDEDDEDEDWRECEYPVIAASTRYSDAQEAYIVSRVTVDEDGRLTIYGFRCEYGCPMDADELCYIEYGHISSITDYILETATVKDVSGADFAPQPILVFSRADVENVGYSQDMTPEQYKELARAMKKAMEWNMDIYWIALRQACENVEITPLNTSEANGED